MFLNKEPGKEEEIRKPDFGQEPESARIFSNKFFIYTIGAFLGLAIIAVVFLITVIGKQSKPQSPLTGEKGISQVATSTEAIRKLPGDLGNGGINGFEFGTSTENIKAEDLTFGHFYKKEEDDFKSTLASYTLPINIKVDASNYYDVARKINLDPYIENINSNGFAISDNQFRAEADSFFDVYRFLIEKDIPVVVTNDFLFYYFQNTWKEVYKEIEKSAFYENIWDINKKLYTISLTRYKQRLEEAGLSNDPVLEGERLELAYFAVVLKLLMPTTNQINTKLDFSDDSKFYPQEAEIFSFEMPEYLKEDVEKEVKLIREAERETKSPVLLYLKNYQYFTVPANYKNNAKLNNFYLTLQWLNSVFPLYYQSEDCANCLLDRDDWIINMAAASFIAKDLFDNQDLKNQWAIIYKFISFFSGLKQDLTYLQYQDALTDLFGDNYIIENIFSHDNQKREEDLLRLQEKISSFRFSAIEGSFDRNNELTKPFLGMRILQESYWPNDYIFNQLTGVDLRNKVKVRDVWSITTACPAEEKGSFYRCGGFGLDIINLMNSVEYSDDYFNQNTDYYYYDTKVEQLRNQINNFNVYSWNNNIYWVTLDIAKLLLEYDRSRLSIFVRTNSWQQLKDVNTALGAWVNLHLPEDKYISYFEQEGSSLGKYTECNKYNYIEPNVKFLQELIAKNDMLINMLAMLKVTEKTNAASAELKELNKIFKKILDISKKELSNELIDEEDCKFINDLISHYLVEEKGDKIFTIDFARKSLKESIEGVKLLTLVYNQDNKKIIAVGPIFNYKEN